MRYKKDFHEPIIREWIRERGLSEELINDLPVNGMLSFENGEAVAACFLRVVEGGGALIDSLITNPKKTSDERHRALNLVTRKLLESAKDAKLVKVMATTVDPSVLGRASKLGFKILPHTVVALNLSDFVSGEDGGN